STPDSSGATVLDDLPEWLVVEEILVRLPTKDVLRCRAVQKSWRAATSTDKFILDHHRRQPLLPIIEQLDEGLYCLASAGDQKIRPVLRYTPDPVSSIAVIAACDGLLILSGHSSFYICNPATRKCAPLPHPPLRPGFSGATVVAFYRHHASGEHRVLWSIFSAPVARVATVERSAYFVLPVGSDQPRCVQWPTVKRYFPATRSRDCPPVDHRGGLHWALGLGITVFDTVTETFRQMSRPAQLPPGGWVSLCDMGGGRRPCHSRRLDAAGL
uniref:F-box domain-containing protein n=1 Tax=Triticum urartu TaxID=4572 RepID=A0A8R7PLV8_TRIUA